MRSFCNPPICCFLPLTESLPHEFIGVRPVLVSGRAKFVFELRLFLRIGSGAKSKVRYQWEVIGGGGHKVTPLNMTTHLRLLEPPVHRHHVDVPGTI